MHDSLLELLSRLAALQNSNGSFSSCSTHNKPPIDSVYFTSLIIISLRHTYNRVTESYRPLIESITLPAVDFLITQASTQTTWNYFPRALPSPYPDDLDDTFLALEAIECWKNDFINAERLAHITTTLIRCEMIPGGPYKTWITEKNTTAPWNDIDSVINSTVNRWLVAHEIILEPLQKYIEKWVINNKHESLYYHQNSFINYLTRNSPVQKSTSRVSVIDNSHFNHEHPLNSIIHDLVAFYHTITTSIDTIQLQSSLTKVLSCTTRFDFFIEEIKQDNYHYAYCEAMEIVLCSELVGLTHQSKTGLQKTDLNKNNLENTDASDTHTANTSAPLHLAQVRETLIATFGHSSVIRKFFVKQFDDMLRAAPHEFLLPYHYYYSLHKNYRDRMTISELITVTAAHAIGIITFTLQDAIIDQQQSPAFVPYVSSGALAMENLFEQALFQVSSRETIHKIITTMNTSLLRETHLSQDTPLQEGGLGDKSIGLMCSIITIITITGGQYTYRESEVMIRIFSNILTVKQLLDDFHDWYEDLTHKRTTLVTQKIISYAQKFNPTMNLYAETNKVLLGQLFWNQVFPDLYTEGMQLLDETQKLSSRLVMVTDTSFISDRITKLRNIFKRTHNERAQLLQFISAYEKATPSGGS